MKLGVTEPVTLRLKEIHNYYKENVSATGYIVWTGTGSLPAIPPEAPATSVTVTHAHYDDIAPSGQNRWIVVGCIGTNPSRAYANLSGIIVA